jgi:hypothetical protein
MSDPPSKSLHAIQVRATADLRLLCATCDSELSDHSIALLLRRRKGGPFDPLCVWCTHRIVQSASFAFQLDDAIERLST